jgi:hypothetical protein
MERLGADATFTAVFFPGLLKGEGTEDGSTVMLFGYFSRVSNTAKS